MRARWPTAVVLVGLTACAAGGGSATPTATAPIDPVTETTVTTEITVTTVTTVTATSTTVPGTTLVPVPPSTTSPALATTTAGCGAASPPAPGDGELPLTAAGLDGTIIRRLPPSYDGTTPLPVVFGLHGWSQPAVLLGLQSNLPAAADRDGFVLVLPHVTRSVPIWDAALDGADADWFGAVLDAVESTLCVDPERFFVTGMSNGAMMASTVVCRFADRIAAVGLVAGIRLPDGCAPARRVPIVAFHGTDDGFLAYDGGFGPAVARLSSPDGAGTLGDVVAIGPDAVPIPERAAGWSTLNGCGADLDETRVADDVVALSVEPCDAPVLLYAVDGGGHTWPGSEFDQSIGDIVGPTTTSIDATELMLAFFVDAVT